MKKICIVEECKKEFETYDKPKKHGRRQIGKRPYGCKTCSPKCAKINSRKIKK